MVHARTHAQVHISLPWARALAHPASHLFLLTTPRLLNLVQVVLQHTTPHTGKRQSIPFWFLAAIL